MRTIDVIQGNSNRNQTLRLLLLLIIVGTFPFYCLAVIIIGSAPVDDAQPLAQITEVDNATFTPLGNDKIDPPVISASPLPFASMTPLSILRPTPRQFLPPTAIPTDQFVAQTVVIPTPALVEPTASREPVATAQFADLDGDGVRDEDDTCPDRYGYADNGGCPYPDDPDLDGLRSDVDVCPNEFAPESPRGCRDFDDDGLDSSQDNCPDQAGPSSNQGCPLDDATAGG